MIRNKMGVRQGRAHKRELRDTVPEWRSRGSGHETFPPRYPLRYCAALAQSGMCHAMVMLRGQASDSLRSGLLMKATPMSATQG